MMDGRAKCGQRGRNRRRIFLCDIMKNVLALQPRERAMRVNEHILVVLGMIFGFVHTFGTVILTRIWIRVFEK